MAIINSERHRYPVLDALRGTAAVGVLITHSLQIFVGAGLFNHTPLRIFANGRCFVIFFFVLSGFVLATAIWGDKGRTGYATYVARRLARLYPPYAAAGLLGILSMWFFGQALRPMDVLGYALAVGNSDGTAIDPPSWSLVYELRLSLVMPLLSFVISRNHKAALWITVVAFIAIETAIVALKLGQFPYAVDDVPSAILFTARYAICFAVGALLARGNMQGASVFGLVARHPLIAGLFAYIFFSGLLDQTSIIGASLIIILALRSPWLQGFMNHAPFVWLGRISYSLYLTHILTLKLMVYLLEPQLKPGLIVALLFPVALIVAEVFYRMVEAPAIRLSRRIGRRDRAATSPVDASAAAG